MRAAEFRCGTVAARLVSYIARIWPCSVSSVIVLCAWVPNVDGGTAGQRAILHDSSSISRYHLHWSGNPYRCNNFIQKGLINRDCYKVSLFLTLFIWPIHLRWVISKFLVRPLFCKLRVLEIRNIGFCCALYVYTKEWHLPFVSFSTHLSVCFLIG